jgi:gamma-glutamylputrescine oxidase
MTVSIWMDRNQNKVQAADVVIVGGGIAGLSTAYWLHQEDPSLEIVIVEKMQLGDGATGRNAGFITCGSVEHFNRLVGKHGKSEAEQIWKFSEENLRLLKDHIIKSDCPKIGFHQNGSFSLASTESEFTELKKSAELMREQQIRVEVLGVQDIKQRLGVEHFVGGIKYLDDGSVHPLLLLGLLKERLLQAAGTKIHFVENAEVFAIENDPVGAGKVVRTKAGMFKCSLVVLATNGYSSLLHPYFKDKIFPTRGQILATEPVPKFMEGPCYANFVLDYFRQLPTGELVIGGFRQLQKDTELGYSDETSEVIQSALDQFIQHHIPTVKSAKITHRWTGVMGFSVDGQPLVGSLPDDPQTFFVGGFTAHGLGLAFHCAKVLVDSMFGRAIPSYLSAKRFGG